MKFSMRSLILLLTAASIYVAIVFALPDYLSYLLLALGTLFTPAVVIGGLVYSRRNWRAFWCGYGATALMPLLYFGFVSSMMMGYGAFDGEEARTMCYVLAGIQLLPIFGGLATVAMRRIFKSQRGIAGACCVAD